MNCANCWSLYCYYNHCNDTLFLRGEYCNTCFYIYYWSKCFFNWLPHAHRARRIIRHTVKRPYCESCLEIRRLCTMFVTFFISPFVISIFTLYCCTLSFDCTSRVVMQDDLNWIEIELLLIYTMFMKENFKSVCERRVRPQRNKNKKIDET